jgi:hypothetical protein
MNAMQFDFSALDAELESLGRPPDDALALARRYAPHELGADPRAKGSSLTLDDVDRTLAALAEDNGELGLAPAPAWSAPELRVERRVPSLESEAPPPPRRRTPIPAPLEAAPSPVPAPLEAAPQPLEHQPPALAEAPPAPESLPPAAASQPPAAPESVPPPPESVPPPAQARPAALTQSQEIVLPDPIARDELSTESGELRLDGDGPSSGSFELPETSTEPRISAAEPAPPAQAAGGSPLLPFDDIQDALEGSQPIMLDSARASGRGTFSDRDPDAEFDALLSEATDPRGIPTGLRAGASGEVDTDDLLRGLEGDELADDEVSPEDLAAADADEPHEADLLTRSLFEDAGEATEITDRATLAAPPRAVQAAEAEADDEASLDDELDAGDLEIVMEEEDETATLAPPAAQLSKGPPPPPPPGGDKRPSLLGRLFTKREDE